ncbi:hypothetical protein Tsubulata_051006 [Turnera subulata]|uniref:Disease resistance R13L4/SHOC-2-like LRR domain-containing protein n=1 Tax=Turnera subulata TaxID=218843 RepID=A0A9Q0G5W0_9ROSI|nr:hypothetical protein Tsubulata_051006 [Turnera subulata]
MHDMLRELALSISKEEKFCASHDERKGARPDGVIRRLSIQASGQEIETWKGMKKLRSFHLFATKDLDPTMNYKFLDGFKLLRVLSLEGAPIETFPDHIVTLFNLRYLSLERTRIKKVPESIGRLYNLQFLNICWTQVEALPSGIVKLRNLRFLLSNRLNNQMLTEFGDLCGTQFPKKLSTLNNLLYLGTVEANSFVIKEIRSMTQLVRLDISNVEGSHEEDLCFAIQNMPLLCLLFVKAVDEDVILPVNALQPPPRLEKLTLYGKLENIPQWFQSLQNLSYLALSWSRLTNDPLPHLEALPNLRALELVKACEEPHLDFKNGFRNLEWLAIRNFSNLQSITIAEGVMPGIKKLYIGFCGMLTEVPSGIKCLTKLQELWLINLAEDVTKRIEEPSGVDRPNVQHIKKITYIQTSSTGWWSERNLSSFFEPIPRENGFGITDISEEANPLKETKEDYSGGDSKDEIISTPALN